MGERLRRIVCACGVVVVVTPLGAHHGAATFETGTELTLKGSVVEWIWANPHCFLKFSVTDVAGTTTEWVAETQNPVSMSARGWARSSFKPGDGVTVTVEPAKNGAPVGRIRVAITANGTSLNAMGAEPIAVP